MPFGGWTKHVLRYVFRMPLDHPLRTNFLSNLAEQAYNGDQSGLPEYLFHLLYLGHPDADGNVTTIDFRQWNPLRDVANYMTTAGWLTQLNPLAEGLMSHMGINSTTGAPELYPTLTYDSFYGGYQAQTPSSLPGSLAQAYIPEVSALDHFFKLSSYTKTLAKTDPSAYSKQLWQSLNFPWTPPVDQRQSDHRQAGDRPTEFHEVDGHDGIAVEQPRHSERRVWTMAVSRLVLHVRSVKNLHLGFGVL